MFVRTKHVLRFNILWIHQKVFFSSVEGFCYTRIISRLIVEVSTSRLGLCCQKRSLKFVEKLFLEQKFNRNDDFVESVGKF